MKRLICGALLLLAATLCGCSDHPRTTALLAQAEALLAERPDSALQLLRQLPAERLGSRALKARYALLTAEACARAGSDAETDSLLDAAWDYYRNRPDEIRNRCRTRYYQGRSRLRRGDKPGALRLFLEVEEELLLVDEPYYRGLLCLRIGEVHYAELDFAGAYRRFREARNLFMRSERPRQTVEALLGMTSSALRMRDPERARRDCTLALDLADELQDEALAGRCLACFATLYTVSDRERIPDELLQRIDRSVRGDTTATGLRTLAQVQLLRQHPKVHRVDDPLEGSGDDPGTARRADGPPHAGAGHRAHDPQRGAAHRALHGLPHRDAGRMLPRGGPDDSPLHLPERLADAGDAANLRRDDREGVFPRTDSLCRLPDAEPPHR